MKYVQISGLPLLPSDTNFFPNQKFYLSSKEKPEIGVRNPDA